MIKLYTVLKNVSAPLGVAFAVKGGYQARTKNFDPLVLMRWPDGRPCHLVNYWLTDLCGQTRARDTAKVYAACLSHQVRFCFDRQIEMCNFDDDHFYNFTEYLKTIRKNNAKHSAEHIDRNRIRFITRC